MSHAAVLEAAVSCAGVEGMAAPKLVHTQSDPGIQHARLDTWIDDRKMVCVTAGETA